MADDDEFEDDEQLDEEDLGDEETDNGDEIADDDDNDEEDDEEEQDSQQMANADKTAITNRLKKLEKSLKKRPVPILSPKEKRLIKQGKAVNPKLAYRIELLSLRRKASAARKTIIGGGVLVSLLPVILVVLVLVMIGSIISSIFGSRYNDDGTPAPSELALNGNQIYAARAFYTDDAAANKKIINDYCGYIASAIEGYNSTSSEFTLNITLPANAFDYSEFLTMYTDTQYGYYRLARLSYIFAQNVNLQYGLNKTETDFAGIINDIQYFGLEQSQFEEAMGAVANEIVKNGEDDWYTPKEGNNQPNMSNDALSQSLIEASNFSASELTQKVFVVDSVVEGDNTLAWFNAGATANEKTKKYLAIMYFPHANFSIGSLSYAFIKTGEGEVVVHYGENSYKLQAVSVEDDNYTYESEEINLNVSASEKPAVLLSSDATLSELFSQIKSQDEQNLDTYFDVQEVDGKNVYTYKLFNLYAEFNFDDYFSFADQNNSY